MSNLEVVVALLGVAIIVVLVGLRLRRTPDLGGPIEPEVRRPGGLAINSVVSKKLATTSAKSVLSISMQTRRTPDGKAQSTESITIDGQTYGSIDEIPPEVRDRVRTLLAKARKPGPDAGAGADAALARIETDLAALGLDLRDPDASTEGPPAQA